ncbi:heme exporter protein CcmB [Bartonella ancashensis]|uniref:Heme exporter protein B n=1 Tax=Bartonella ancashensis TaxID=1318743 RepID=A0A0M4M5K9_9HYPH|nr:heme exporter protein CcmB [Bartonella ancashensis]ALE03367.1 ABC transporter involved in cytochrome c biogenesis, CcmB subunit [Bartonella ancashensis]
MKALFWRDLKLALTPQSPLLTGLLFFIAIIMIIPFAVGPDPDTLTRVGPGILWIGALLAGLLNLHKLFQADHDDGTLDQFILSDQRKSLIFIIFVKCFTHWAGTMLPLIFITPLLSFMLHLNGVTIFAAVITLLCGTPAIIFIGAIGAALTTSLIHSTLLIFIIILPWTIPVVIFGVSATTAMAMHDISFITVLSFLIALSLFLIIFSSFIVAIILKYLSE